MDLTQVSTTVHSNGDSPNKPEDFEKTTNNNSISLDHGRHLLHLYGQQTAPVASKEVKSKVEDGGVMTESSDQDEGSTDDKLNPTQSLIQSIPVTKAEPEIFRTSYFLAYATEVETVIDTDRIPREKQAKHNDEKRTRPALISIRVHKPSIDFRLGIAFQAVFGELLIGNINPSSLLAHSPLRRGDRLVNVDHHRSTSHWTALQAANYMREKEGTIGFVVHTKNGDPNFAEAAVYKSSRDEKLGISLRNDYGRLRIKNITSEGLLGNMSVLRPGDFVISINDMDVSGLDPSFALEIISNSIGLITIRVTNIDATEVSVREVLNTHMSSRAIDEGVLATADEITSWDLESGLISREDFDFCIRPGYISFKVYKPTVDTKLGITFSRTDDDQLQIGSIASDGMLGKLPLAPGLIILSIGHFECRQWTKQQALDFVKGTVGDVLFMFYDPAGSTSYAMAMAYKSSPRSKIGLSFKSSGDHVQVGSILSDGIFYDSVLNIEDAVISINNVPCQHLTPSEVVAITQRIPESVIVLVKLFRSNCIVVGCKKYNNHMTQEQDDGSGHGPQKMPFWLCICFIFIIIIVISIAGSEECDPDEYC